MWVRDSRAEDKTGGSRRSEVELLFGNHEQDGQMRSEGQWMVDVLEMKSEVRLRRSGR